MVRYKKLEFHSASFEVKEHHVAVYVDMGDETIVKAQRPMDAAMAVLSLLHYDRVYQINYS